MLYTTKVSEKEDVNKFIDCVCQKLTIMIWDKSILSHCEWSRASESTINTIEKWLKELFVIFYS